MEIGTRPAGSSEAKRAESGAVARRPTICNNMYYTYRRGTSRVATDRGSLTCCMYSSSTSRGSSRGPTQGFPFSSLSNYDVGGRGRWRSGQPTPTLLPLLRLGATASAAKRKTNVDQHTLEKVYVPIRCKFQAHLDTQEDKLIQAQFRA